MTKRNIILSTDSYKFSHWEQQPPDTQFLSAYIEPRRKPHWASNEVVNFGLQAIIKEYFLDPITKEDIEEAEDLIRQHGFNFNRKGWEHILNKHGGYLPLRIQALPEGMVFPVRLPQVQVVNTDPVVPWLTTYVETVLVRGIWYPSTVATYSREAKKIIKSFLVDTADNIDGLDFKLHDFGGRGATSSESVQIGGAAHLISFKGTDSFEAIVGARKYYDATMPGFSIPAAEHSTITSWGREHEADAFRNMITKFGKPGALVAVVSDSYDIRNAVSHIWGKELKDLVIQSGATIVIRPDSGEPTKIVPEVLDMLGEKFGFSVNSKGYKMLPSCVRVIQGDGIKHDTIATILSAVKLAGWSTDNLAMGMGSGLLQEVTRDDYGYAMKANEIVIDGVKHDVYKQPIDDPGKSSKAGRQFVYKTESYFVNTKEDGLLPWNTDLEGPENLLKDIYIDGELLKEVTFDEIRERAKIA